MNESDHNAQESGNDELYLVDGSGFIFRAYYAMAYNRSGPAMTNPKGEPVSAVFVFVNMLLKLLNDYHAPYMAVIFDAARVNFRNDIYPAYKANRDETPEDLIPQFPLVHAATAAFDIPAIQLEGFEADDLIAAYTRLARAQGKKVVIVSSDKDLMQLVDEDVRMLDPMKGHFIGVAEVMEKFGVMPDRVVDVQALAGDATDNVPGVPGIGIKTAAQLINEYGSLEALLARAHEIKQPKRRAALVDNAELARISKRLVRLDENAPVPVALEDLKTHDPERPALRMFLQEQGFKSILTRLGMGGAVASSVLTTGEKEGEAKGSEEAREPDFPPASMNRYILINRIDILKQWIDRAYETGFLAIDTETTGLTPAKATLVGICLSAEIGEGAYIPLGHKEKIDLLGGDAGDLEQLPLDEVLALLKPVLEDDSVLKIGHNMKYDWQMLAKHGIHMHPCDDTMLLSYVLDGTEHGHGMDALSELFCGHTPIKYEDVAGKGKNAVTFDYVPLEKALDYAAEDAEITLRLHKILKSRLAQEKMTAVYEDIERPLIPVIAEMELAGIRVDAAFLKNMSSEFGKKLALLEEEIHKLAGHKFNVASPKQMGEVLFGELGIDGGKKTKTGDWSTAVDVLEKLSAQGHEIVDKILEWRQLSKLKSTYTDALPEQINPATGRIHTSYHMTGTSTGRLASSDPNLQNIPIRSEEGRKIREAFIAEEGHVLLSVDYSQVELRLVAELAGVKALQKAFREGVDIHALTAAQVFGVPLDAVTPELRRQAKAVNFGIIYGISGWGLAKQLGCSPGEASEFIRRYLAKFSEIQAYMEARKEEARQYGFVRTLYGRKCTIPNIQNKMPHIRNGAERQAINAPLQGTAADILKRAMARMPGALKEAGLSARMLLQVHDELIFEVPEHELEKTSALVRAVMETVAALEVPLIAEAGSGKNWAQAH
ncbi:MAG: DNA polymerase I [Alphaproteobacteria bacterium CG_4_9_14_3_um_filter_47_13]|nr:MAG: DNA polymerase I [Alphaproteobacteria bacterium CG_4_9_14_3_um_filter_47_13]